MAHSLELRWKDITAQVASSASTVLTALLSGENLYQDLLVSYQDAGGTDQDFADRLFGSTATAEQVQMTTDLRLCMQAIHELHDAMNNQVVTQDDRSTKLRRLS